MLFITIGTFAQKAEVKNTPDYDDHPLHFGYTLGLNMMGFTFGRNWPVINIDDGRYVYADMVSKMPGFQVGAIVDFRLGEYFNLRALPSFNFGQRNISYFTSSSSNIKETYARLDSLRSDINMSLESSMLDLPILLKYKARRVNNYRPYVIAGGSVRYDLMAKKTFNDNIQQYLLLKPFDCYAEMGVGIDYYLPYFKFSTELKYSVGLLDVLNHNADDAPYDVYVKALNSLRSNIIMLSFHFE